MLTGIIRLIVLNLFTTKLTSASVGAKDIVDDKHCHHQVIAPHLFTTKKLDERFKENRLGWGALLYKTR